jgi:hypothetical protein
MAPNPGAPSTTNLQGDEMSTFRTVLASVLSVAIGVNWLAAQSGAASGEAGRVKAAYLKDFTDLEKKYVALAEAFPAEKYTWRPMEGTRSVSQVLGLVAGENYLDVAPAFGGKTPAEVGTGDAARGKLEALTDKAAMVKHIRESFALARRAISSWSGSAEAPFNVWGVSQPVVAAAMMVAADQHEHLGQLIAYARINKIVPPWSRRQ